MSFPKTAAISPTVNALMNTEEGKIDELTSAFERNLSELAYNKISASMPEIMDSIVTFKILDSDAQVGYGVGVFVVQRQDKLFYVPLVFSNNKAYPMDVVYLKDLDRFVPFSKEWLTEVETMEDPGIGNIEDYSEGVSPDVDLGNITTPPVHKTTFASDISADVARVVKQAMLGAREWQPQLRLVDFLKQSPEHIKLGFKNWLSSSKKHMKTACNIYGTQELIQAMRPKIATGNDNVIEFLDTQSPSSKFKEYFGKEASLYFKRAAEDGVTAKDDRSGLNRPVYGAQGEGLKEPSTSGVYWVFPASNEPKKALVVVNPKILDDAKAMPSENKYLLIFDDRSYVIVNRCLTKNATGRFELIKKIFDEPNRFEHNSEGILVRIKNDDVDVRGPFKVSGVQTDSENVTKFTASTPSGKTLAIKINPHAMVDKFVMAKDARTAYVPATYDYYKLKPTDLTLYSDSDDILNELVRKNLEKLSVDNTLHHMSVQQGHYSIDHKLPIPRTSAIKKIAVDFHISVQNAVDLIKLASDNGFIEFGLTKQSQMPIDPQQAQFLAMQQGGIPMDPSMMGGMPPGGGMPMDPSMMGGMPPGGGMPMDPSMMQPPEVNPTMMNAAMNLQDPRVFDAAAISSLMSDTTLVDFMNEYLPDLNKALDALARLLLTFRMKQDDIEGVVGINEFGEFEKDLRNVFDKLGDVILRFNKNVEATKRL